MLPFEQVAAYLYYNKEGILKGPKSSQDVHLMIKMNFTRFLLRMAECGNLLQIHAVTAAS